MPPAMRGKPLKILILEDSPLFRKSLHQLAKRNHFQIAGETDQTKELPRLIEKKSPHAALIDLVIPEQDTLEMIGLIKKRFPSLPLIVCSSLREEHIVSRVLEAGCFDYIFKPFEEKRLVESLKRAVA